MSRAGQNNSIPRLRIAVAIAVLAFAGYMTYQGRADRSGPESEALVTDETDSSNVTANKMVVSVIATDKVEPPAVATVKIETVEPLAVVLDKVEPPAVVTNRADIEVAEQAEVLEAATEQNASEAAEAPASSTPTVGAKPSAVRLVRQDDGSWTLLRGGKPYFVKGVGGDSHLKDLVAAGGNSIRTWGMEERTQAILDEAHSLGITVTLGHWLGHKRHGFDYGNTDQVAKQLKDVIRLTKQFKDHPALLAWGVGNEVETDQEENITMWQAIEEAAAAIKEIDPDHPTVCVVAELGRGNFKARLLNQHCPSIDIIGINAYDYASSAGSRLASTGIDTPYLLTEYGPPLPGDLKLEPTSTEKAYMYRRTYKLGIEGQSNCLGGYSFLWGAKLEGTDTYFGQFLESGERLAQMEIFYELFGGAAPTNLVPQSEPMTFDDPTQTVAVGEDLSATWRVTDPDGDALTYRWELKAELARTVGGDATAGRKEIKGALRVGRSGQVTIRHSEPGRYRLYGYAFDGHGNAATTSASVAVDPR